MTKLEELKKKLQRYQKKYNKLLKKTGEWERSRYGHAGEEIVDIQLRVLETAIVEIKKEIAELKRKRKPK